MAKKSLGIAIIPTQKKKKISNLRLASNFEKKTTEVIYSRKIA